jgi:hypothetical protein
MLLRPSHEFRSLTTVLRASIYARLAYATSFKRWPSETIQGERSHPNKFGIAYGFNRAIGGDTLSQARMMMDSSAAIGIKTLSQGGWGLGVMIDHSEARRGRWVDGSCSRMVPPGLR